MSNISDKHLHIVSFDIPYPANYGGVIDVFFRIKALSERGVKIHLHCFEYGREHSEYLESFCHSVNYYKRATKVTKLFNSLPYIVCSRDCDELMSNLMQDDYPILLEGLHCCGVLMYDEFKYRNVIVRAHNIEHEYGAQGVTVEETTQGNIGTVTAQMMVTQQLELDKINLYDIITNEFKMKFCLNVYY